MTDDPVHEQLARDRLGMISAWRTIDSAPRDGKQRLLNFGESVPGVLEVAAGLFVAGDDAESLGYTEYADDGGWLIYNVGSRGTDFYVVAFDEPIGWADMPLPTPPVTP